MALKTNDQIEQASIADGDGIASIDNSRLFMWAIAAVIVASLVYVTALERTRDFAVLKALGATSGQLFVGLAFQAVLVALVAAVVGAVLIHFMVGLFAQPVDIPGSAYVVLPISALVVGLLASLARAPTSRRRRSGHGVRRVSDGRTRSTRPDSGVQLRRLRGTAARSI